MEKQNYNKYKYVPDVRPIMRRAGLDIDLIEILNDHAYAKARTPSPGETSPRIGFEILYYRRGDING